MNWFMIFVLVVTLGVILATFRLLLAWLLGFDVEEYSLFAGPKLFSFKLFGTTFSLRLLPIGAFITLNVETFEVHNGLARFLVRYLPEILSYSFIIWYLLTPSDPTYAMAGKVFIVLNIITSILGFIFKSLILKSKN